MPRLPDFFGPPPPADVFHWFDPATTSRFRSGYRVGVLNCRRRPHPWVELDHEWCRVQARPWPVVERSRVTWVGLHHDIGRPGLFFGSIDGRYTNVVLFPRDPHRVLQLFAHHRWPTA